MSEINIITLDQESGYFNKGGAMFVPMGFNYWPASCGTEMWVAWPEEEIREDIIRVASMGMNTIRFFLRWQDFEPAEGVYCEESFSRLDRFLYLCRENGIFAHPSLFVGWMCGGIFAPEWKGNRNLFSDPDIRVRAKAFVKKAAEVCRGYMDNFLAFDLGNELGCLPDSGSARILDIEEWCREISDVLRHVCPGALVISGCDHHQFLNDSGWHLDGQTALDLLSMHAYPVPDWNNLPFDGMEDPLCHSMLPFYTQAARTFRPVFIQEFGVIPNTGGPRAEQYLRAILPRCWEAGANGFLFWNLRDITAKGVFPYTKVGFERKVGFLDVEGNVKPGLGYFLEFADSVRTLHPPVDQPDAVGIYWPVHFYERDDMENPGNSTNTLARRMVACNFLLRSLEKTTGIVRHADMASGRDVPEILINTGADIDETELEALVEWVDKGGCFIWHGPTMGPWGHAYCDLLGAYPIDKRLPKTVTVSISERIWQFDKREGRPEISISTAEILAYDSLGLPALFKHRIGKGVVIWTPYSVEDQALSVMGDTDTRRSWAGWYEKMLEFAKKQ